MSDMWWLNGEWDGAKDFVAIIAVCLIVAVLIRARRSR